MQAIVVSAPKPDSRCWRKYMMTSFRQLWVIIVVVTATGCIPSSTAVNQATNKVVDPAAIEDAIRNMPSDISHVEVLQRLGVYPLDEHSRNAHGGGHAQRYRWTHFLHGGGLLTFRVNIPENRLIEISYQNPDTRIITTSGPLSVVMSTQEELNRKRNAH